MSLKMPTENKTPTKERKRRISQDSSNYRDDKMLRTLSVENPAANEDEEEEKEEHTESNIKLTNNNIGEIEIPWRRSTSWKSLDFILSLQGKQLSIQKKIELAYDFINSARDNKPYSIDGRRSESVSMLRLVPFLNDWIQSILISVDKRTHVAGEEEFDPCLNFQAWNVFKFCLKEPSSSQLSFSPNLLRAVSRVIRHALSGSGESLNLFEIVSECFSLLFSLHGRSFNASVDAWVSAANASLDLALKIFEENRSACANNVGDVLLGLSCSVLQPFTNYLRIHPSPKNIFRVVVDRLLEQLLAVLVSSSCLVNGSNCDLLKIVEDILSNGLFHPAHIEGFLSIYSSEKYGMKPDSRTNVKEPETYIKSYHKHLFWRLEQFSSEKKLSALGGLGQLLGLFVGRVKKQKRAPDTRVKSEISSGKHNSVSENSLSVVSPDEEMCKSVFDIFVQFMEPLILGIKSYSKINWSEVGDCSLTFISEAHLILKSINKMLASFMHEKIYSRTKDTSEGAHFNFLKEVYDMIVSFTTQIRVLWQSASVKENERYAEMLLSVAKEVIVSVSHFLEIEYKVIMDELFGLWLLMISFMAADLSIAETHHLTSEILSLGCRLVNLYSDLRQVDEPIFALCRAVRFLGFPTNDGGSRFVSSMPCYLPEACVKSLVTLLSSQQFRHVVSAAVKSIPEGQSSGCIRELKMDVIKSLEWMKSSNLEAMGEEREQTKVPNSNALDLSLQAELLGKGLSEIYTLLLDSSTVTTGNSIPVGNSVRDLMTAIQPTLGCLVQNHSDTLDDFFLAGTGRRFPSHKMDENKSSTYWFLVFFFRIYISCRSLNRQLLSLMPPGSSRKASAAMGDLFTAFSGKDWLERTDWTDGGYFSWIIKPSIPLMAIVQSISNMFLQNKCAAEAPLVFVLHTMAFQRLVDLNRQIKASEFLQEKDARLDQTELMEVHISVLKQEATDLTNFLTGYLPLMVKEKQYASLSVEGDVTGVGQDMLVVDEFNSWDFAVCSLDESSLPTAIWWLLCQNTDVWCPHATKKCVKKFLSLLFQHLLSSISGFKIMREQNWEEPGRQMMVTPRCISIELLTDATFYEQTFLCRHLTSRFCHILKKSLSSLFRHSMSSDASFGSIPDWSVVLSKLEAQGVGLNDNYDCSVTKPSPVPCNLQHKKSHKGGKDFSLNFIDLVTCQNLLNLLCWIPKGYESSRSLSIYLTYILNIESLVVPSLLDHKGHLFLHNHYELLRLFVSCRRALRYLLVVSDEENLESRQCSLVPVLFENTFSLVWLWKSVSEVVVISPALHEEDRSRQVKDMMFSLMDHTFHIFTILSESHTKAAVQALTNEQSPGKELHIFNGGHERFSVTEADLPSDSTEQFRFLAEETRNLLDTLEKTVQNSKIEAATCVINWNKLSSLVSCCEGYLWGIASTLNSADEASAQSQKRRLFHVLKCLRLDVFEDFINYCLNILLVDDSIKPMSLCASDHHPELDCIDKALGFKKSLRAAFETYEVENSTRDDQEVELMDGKDDYMASGSCDENKNESTNSTNIRSSKKKSMRANVTVNALTEADKINSFELKYLNKSLLQGLVKGERPEVAFAMRQLFVASSAILRLKYLFSSRRFSKAQIGCPSKSTVILIGTSHFLLSEFGEMIGRPDPFSFVWLEGIIKYIEVLGDYFPSADPVLTRSVYTKLIGIHLMAIGKCISLQGKLATLASHETESRTKTLQGHQAFSYNGVSSLCHEQYNLNEFKSRLRMSFKMFIRKALELHLLSAVQALERALVGVQEGCHVIYEITAGNVDGGRVSPVVAAGIDCLDLILESVPGGKRSNVIKRHIQSLVSALFNIVLHIQSASIFFQANASHDKGQTGPDPGSVVLMCVEVLAKVAGKSSLLQMEPTHVAQSLHIPSTLFKHLCQLRALPSSSRAITFKAGEGDRHVDCQFSVELFAACCKLLCTVLRHRKSESERCIALLEDSVTTLLYCLEMVDAGFSRKSDYLVWEVHEGITCASFLRRIYEEIRQQKDVLGRYSFHFLSNYIWIFSGYGPRKTGIRRSALLPSS